MILARSPSPTATWQEISAGLGTAGSRPGSFSPAEQVVARYLSQGLSNREIAAILGKSEATVKNQVSACLRKCGVPTRGRLIALLR
jgi:DNA-binding NarL/FixJ family response regulator